MEYIVYTALSMSVLGNMACNILNISNFYQPVACLFLYAITCFINIKGGAFFWRFNNVLGVVSVAIILVYCFGSLKWTAFVTNAHGSGDVSWFTGGFANFMLEFPLASWFFIGVESVCFTCNTIENPRIVIPRATVACILTLFCTSIFVISVCSSLPPGARQVSFSAFPLNAGFSLIFGWGNFQENHNMGILELLYFPAIFATGYGFVFAYGNLLYSLAQSGMLPQILRKRTQASGTPFVAILSGSLLSYLTALLFYFINFDNNEAFNVCLLSAFVTYCTQCYGFYFVKKQFNNIKGTYQSPVGMYGAFYAGLVFLFGIISIVVFHIAALITILGIWICMSIYYFTVARHQQRISYDEQQSMFVAHVINFNRKAAFRRHNQNSLAAVTIVNVQSSKSSLCSNNEVRKRQTSVIPTQHPEPEEKQFEDCNSQLLEKLPSSHLAQRKQDINVQGGEKYKEPSKY